MAIRRNFNVLVRTWIVLQFITYVIRCAFGENLYCSSVCTCLGYFQDCSSRGLVEVPTDLGLPHPTEIVDLSYNQLSNANFSIFQDLQQLKTITASHSQLNQLPFFGILKNLRALVLHHNNITTLTIGSLETLGKLEILNLNNNKISHISAGFFPAGIPLKEITLNNNRISTIEAGSFDNLTSLEHLSMNKNYLPYIPKDIFRKLSRLKHLELKHNHLTKLEGLSFHGLESLTFLKLERNHISVLLDGAFWGLNSIQELDLQKNRITNVTKKWMYGLSSLQQLFLQHNKISFIEDDVWSVCSQLWKLDISHNRIREVRKNTLSKLSSLLYLKLSYNRISDMEDGAYKSLVSLKVLDMNKNRISWVIEDGHGMFAGMEKLTQLKLTSNNIKSINKDAFLGLENLQDIDLLDNDIVSIDEHSLHLFKHMTQFWLNTSSLLCDCTLAWLPEWLNTTGFYSTVSARCAHPDWVKNKTVFEVKLEDFTCDDRAKPRLVEELKTQVVLRGDNVTLSCTATSGSTDVSTFLWKKDNAILKNAKIENRARVTDIHLVTEYVTALKLVEVSDRDEGSYQCIITNQYGTSYSQKAKITVHVYPAFIKIPSDVTIKSGNTVRLDCAAIGKPKPTVAWQKDGGIDFPAATERRMHFSPSEDAFYIASVKTSDIGFYSCIAKNAAGLVMANASVHVLG